MQKGNFTDEYIPAFERTLVNTHKGIVRIPIKHNGRPVLLVSAKGGEVWPSRYMPIKMTDQLKDVNSAHTYKHIALEGGTIRLITTLKTRSPIFERPLFANRH